MKIRWWEHNQKGVTDRQTDISQYEQTHNMMQVWPGKLSELQLPVQNPAREGACTNMSYKDRCVESGRISVPFITSPKFPSISSNISQVIESLMNLENHGKMFLEPSARMDIPSSGKLSKPQLPVQNPAREGTGTSMSCKDRCVESGRISVPFITTNGRTDGKYHLLAKKFQKPHFRPNIWPPKMTLGTRKCIGVKRLTS